MSATSAPSLPLDPVGLAAELIRCASVTPADAGALDALTRHLAPLDFRCERMKFSEAGTPDIDNLYARFGTKGRNFCFAGHSDVVPVGDLNAWTVDPFKAEIKAERLYGRGAADMKGSIAAFIAAASRIVASGFDGSISLLITGDEEGPSINGTVKMLQTLQARSEKLDHVLVGEPTCVAKLGDMVKIGRRGSVNFRVTARGSQGHVAYPHLADNPLPRLIEMLKRLTSHELDTGTAHFQPSNLEVTSIDTGNPATNIIPASATAMINIRFNDRHSGASLTQWLRGICDAVTQEMGGTYEMESAISGEAFLTEPGELSALVAGAVKDVTGLTPELSTSGGTSDARFICKYAPVIEFGLANLTMHKIDENVPLSDIQRLADIYELILRRYFALPESARA